MGAWGYHIFEDDSACDALDSLCNADDTAGEIESYIDEVLECSDDYIDFDTGTYGLTAAGIVAAVLNGGDLSLLAEEGGEVYGLDEVIEKLDREKLVPLRKKAAQAAQIVIGDNSELCELWQESDDFGS